MEAKNQFFLKSIKSKKCLKDEAKRLDEVLSKLEWVGEILPKTELSRRADELSGDLVNYLSGPNEEYYDKLEKLKSTLGKYWEVKQLGGKNNEIVYNTRLIFPYRIIESNSTYWYIEGIVDDDYHSGMDSHTDDIMSVFKNCQFNEITKDEFINRVNEHVNDVLDIRLRKMKERDEPMIM